MTHSSYRKSSSLIFSLKLTWSWTVTPFSTVIPSKTFLAARLSLMTSFPEKTFSATPSESFSKASASLTTSSPE